MGIFSRDIPFLNKSQRILEKGLVFDAFAQADQEPNLMGLANYFGGSFSRDISFLNKRSITEVEPKNERSMGDPL